MKRYLIVCFAILFAAPALRAQFSTFGHDFYLTSIPSSFNWCSYEKQYQQSSILISSPYDCDVLISYFGPSGGSYTYHLIAKYYLQVTLNAAATSPSNDNGEIAETIGCQIHSDYPITISYYSTGPDNGALFMGYPVSMLGNDYVVTTFPSNDGTGHGSNPYCTGRIDSSSSEFVVIAVQDKTDVTITPSAHTRGNHDAQHPIKTSLKKGQCYWVKADRNNSSDLSGSIIHSTKPVAVIAANENALNGSTNSFVGDQRNLMAQQLVPVKFWKTGDYVTMPFLDAPGLSGSDPSIGDLLRIFSADSNSSNVTLNDGSRLTSGTVTLHGRRYENIQSSTISSSITKPIFVQQCDYRGIGTSEPNTAPTMMNVLPLSSFTRTFLCIVPQDGAQVHKRRFINVIARRDQWSAIKVQINGGKAASITSLPDAGIISIPDHDELQGRRFEVVQPGAYYLRADSNFMVYQFGMVGFDADNTLGISDKDIYYSEYAAPAGGIFQTSEASTISVNYTTLCDSWQIVAKADQSLPLANIELLKDSLGVIASEDGHGFWSSNVSFLSSGAIPGDTIRGVHITVTDPSKNADGWLLVQDVAGNNKIIHLKYVAPAVLFGAESAEGSKGFSFNKVLLGSDTCVKFVLKNWPNPNAIPYDVTDISLNDASIFSIQSITPQLPTLLYRGDSVVINVCYKDTIPLHPVFDSLTADGLCWHTSAILYGNSISPEITAGDLDFGGVPVGSFECRSLNISNTGSAPLTLTKQWVLRNFHSSNFSFNDSLLPYTLDPGKSVNLTICYRPTNDSIADTSIITWGSTISEAYKHTKKDLSVLTGRGLAPHLSWDKQMHYVHTNWVKRDTFRAYLRNYGSASIKIDSVAIQGPTSSEWTIINNQLNRTPLSNFVLMADFSGKHDSIWIDIEFNPNRSLGSIARDTLIAEDGEGIQPAVILNADEFGSGVIDGRTDNIEFSISPNPTSSFATIKLNIAAPASTSFEVLDVLGNTVMKSDTKRIVSGPSEFPVDLHLWPDGVYFVRLTIGESVLTRRIVKTK